MKIQKALWSLLALGLLIGTNVHADDVGVDIPAVAFDFESMPDDPFVIRDMGNKVGYIRSHSTYNEYWGYDNFDFGQGATTLTVRASSATQGGTLIVRLNNENNPSLTVATIDIPNTGGWDSFQDFTVPINQNTIDWFGTNSPSLYFVVEQEDNPGYLFDIESFRFDNVNEGLIVAAEFDGESYPSDDFIIRDMGTQVGYITDFSWIWFNSVEVPVGATSLSVTASSASSGGTVYVTSGAPRVFGGEVIAVIDIANTGGWDQFQEFSSDLESSVEGTVNRMFLSFEGVDDYLFDIESLRFDTN